MEILTTNIKKFLLHDGKNILMVRHGQSIGNQAGTIIGWTDSPLTIKGREQANSLYPSLIQGYKQYNGIYTSDLRRSVDSSNIALGFPSKKIAVDRRIRELHFGDDEGKHFDSMEDAEKDKINSIHYSAKNGESWNDVKLRFKSFLSDLDNRGHYLLFTHGGLMCSQTWDLGLQDVLPNGSVIGLNLCDKTQEPKKIIFHWSYPEITKTML